MNHYSFNVLTEPWIPVVRLDGSQEELGILPCLQQAHELLEIRDPSPIIEFGLYRLLVAFVLDALILAGRRPEFPLDLQVLISEGRFDTELLNNYVTQCGDVFDLFHHERPFLQCRMDNEANTEPIAQIYPALPSGGNVIHWHHTLENEVAVSPAQAARILTAIAPFITAGGRGYSPSINGTPPIYVLPTGSNLFETLVINIPLRSTQDRGDGMIAWRSDRVPGEERTTATMVEALTWRPRRVQLLPGYRVNYARFESGDRTRFEWIDPNVAYSYGDRNARPIRMEENRSIWRDAGPLYLLENTSSGRGSNRSEFRRPDVVQSAFEILNDRRSIRILAYGMRADKAKVFEWTRSVFLVPSALGRHTRLGACVQLELERSEEIAKELREAILRLSPEFEIEEKKLQNKRKSMDKRSIRYIADRCERAYWQLLEPSFYSLMENFSRLDPNAVDDPNIVATAANDWRETIRELATEQFESAAADMDADSDALERHVRARSRLYNRLREVLS